MEHEGAVVDLGQPLARKGSLKVVEGGVSCSPHFRLPIEWIGQRKSGFLFYRSNDLLKARNSGSKLSQDTCLEAIPATRCAQSQGLATPPEGEQNGTST